MLQLSSHWTSVHAQTMRLLKVSVINKECLLYVCVGPHWFLLWQRYAGPGCVSVRYTVPALSSSGNFEATDCQRSATCTGESVVPASGCISSLSRAADPPEAAVSW